MAMPEESRIIHNIYIVAKDCAENAVSYSGFSRLVGNLEKVQLF